MKQLLALFPLTTEQQQQVKDLGVNIVTSADLDAHRVAASDINIIYGWDKTGVAVANTASNQLQWVQTYSAGVDYLPLDLFATQGVQVTNASGIHAAAIAQSILGYIFHFTRGIWAAEQRRPQQQWQQSAPDLLVADETSVLIFGTGHIAVEAARLLKAMGVHVAGVNHSGHSADYFDETYAITDYTAGLAKADIIVNIMPGTPETTGYFNKTFFDQLTDKLLFINVGRGTAVVPADLETAIANGNLKYAALDVVSPEPMQKGNPLWTNDHILLTPHISGVMDHLDQRLFPILFENLTQFVKDDTLVRNQVNVARGY
ncbi:NAD(P)-dependent oxidoreductase [Furfurilactobacillus siliginis]|uniref:3-phosphoglycerate dehydrogenase n=1 Tax=Furfurilactobacillus siliginis TaxID=348151 RepID=A0A0R2L1U8_9LACO|nr:NAD(P)-dependent oxidoreductase [Furfurilactobacillus siliginis]KRN95675.1 D-3-phosphoglycerate dehydrogenase [Furfurilactobacillus siliginis]GEK28062.1 3-phosphoglycerate dehydrogenase [Furfurilactobacillus siliginis]